MILMMALLLLLLAASELPSVSNGFLLFGKSSSSIISDYDDDAGLVYNILRFLVTRFLGNNNNNNGKCDDASISAVLQLRTYAGDSFKDATVSTFPIDMLGQLIVSRRRGGRIALYIHGYREQPLDISIETVVDAYLQSGKDNEIILLDWSGLAFGDYARVASRVKQIAKVVAANIGKLDNNNNNNVEWSSQLHVIGHSLGAQIAGFIGKYNVFQISRITGLDPANPNFYSFGGEHIDSSCAKFVDIIHTDGGVYGDMRRAGSADFYPNGGYRPQPGCPLFGVPLSPNSLCSHWRSWQYYAESVTNEQAFVAVECSSYNDYLDGHCYRNNHVYAGYSVPENISGNFYFLTQSKYPYSMNGINELS